MQTTPEIDAILNELSELCYQTITGDQPFDIDRAEQLVRALVVNGWQRHREHDPPLSELIKRRVREQYLERAMHRGAELEGLAHQIEQMYHQITRYNTRSPQSN